MLSFIGAITVALFLILGAIRAAQFISNATKGNTHVER